MTKRTGSLDPVWTLASISLLGFLACSTAQVAPAPNVHSPVIEQEIFVELPGQTTHSGAAARAIPDGKENDLPRASALRAEPTSS